MKKNAVVFTISSDLVFAVASLVMDIKRVSPGIADEIVVIHNGISERDLRLLNSILPTRGIEYKLPMDDLSLFNQDTLKYFTIMAYAKYECLRLLDEYKNVLYLDPDMVILKDLSCLLERCESGIKMMPSGSPVSAQLHEDVDEYDMLTDGICGCIFVFQDHLDYATLYEFCVSSLAKYAGKLKLAEQAIFDFMIQEFKLQIFPIDRDIYSPHPKDQALIDDAKVIHAYGQPKFWNGLENARWSQNYSVWIKMGGSKYRKRSFLQKVKNKLMKISNRVK